MKCPLCGQNLLRLSEEGVYICPTSRLYFKSDHGTPVPPAGMVESPRKEPTQFDLFLEENGLDARAYNQMDKDAQKSLRMSYLNWLKDRGAGISEKEAVERKHGVKFTPEGFDAWKRRRREIYEALTRKQA